MNMNNIGRALRVLAETGEVEQALAVLPVAGDLGGRQALHLPPAGPAKHFGRHRGVRRLLCRFDPLSRWRISTHNLSFLLCFVISSAVDSLFSACCSYIRFVTEHKAADVKPLHCVKSVAFTHGNLLQFTVIKIVVALLCRKNHDQCLPQGQFE